MIRIPRWTGISQIPVLSDHSKHCMMGIVWSALLLDTTYCENHQPTLIAFNVHRSVYLPVHCNYVSEIFEFHEQFDGSLCWGPEYWMNSDLCFVSFTCRILVKSFCILPFHLWWNRWSLITKWLGHNCFVRWNQVETLLLFGQSECSHLDVSGCLKHSSSDLTTQMAL